MTRVLQCSCKSDKNGETKSAKYQDKIYSPGFRLHNRTNNGWICTICNKEKTRAN